MPSFTFVASFEAVLSVGAIPVLVDVDDTLTLNPAAVRAAITPRTKCIMPVHMCGSMADLDPLLVMARDNGIALLEDACQSIGGTYQGKALGTLGDAGTFSFDFVKMITCGEGGVVMTNRKDVYDKADGYTDHGHDHLGVDRGADLHPFIGYNYRISELHAAVGLAQIRKLSQFLEIQKRNHAALKAHLEAIPEVSFRRVPAAGVDSCSFISWFLPEARQTEALVEKLRENGILAGNFYWFQNNWHYIKKWHHLKQAASLSPLSQQQVAALQKLEHTDFSASDAWLSRCISTSVSLAWTPEQIKEKGEKLSAAIKEVL
jgi:8-amino-3,8-dideoxy-alpha-D-manno-octulosonate transaminase